MYTHKCTVLVLPHAPSATLKLKLFQYSQGNVIRYRVVHSCEKVKNVKKFIDVWKYDIYDGQVDVLIFFDLFGPDEQV